MYRVAFTDNIYVPNQMIVHDIGAMDRVSSGNLELTLDGLGISTFVFSINPKNILYHKAKPLTNFINVYDTHNPKAISKVFSGRILRIENKMSANGEFLEEITCEDKKAFLHDSVQSYMKPTLMGVSEYLKRLIDRHNSQVEPYKRFELGRVTVKDDESVYRGIGYESTADTIREKLLDRLGGYLILREELGSMWLDYLKDYGNTSTTPLQISRNLRSASRDIDIEELGTRIVPLGADLEQNETEEEIGTDFSRPKVNISSVNGGKIYLEDSNLVKEFGIITKTVDFPDTKSPSILKSKGQSYIANQRLMLVTWTVEAVELGLIDPKYEVIQLGNSYPVLNPVLYGKESLQVIEKKVDILQPQRINLAIGSGKKTLSQYQLESRALQSTLQTVYSNLQKSNTSLQALIKEAEELRKQTDLIPEQIDRLKELEKIIEELTNELNGLKEPEFLSGKIIDVSEWQEEIDWEKVKAEGVVFAIIRVQHGVDHEDLTYKQNIAECERLGIRYAVYAYCGFNDPVEEATAFYERVQAAKGKPIFYGSDYEEDVENARSWSEAFVNALNDLGISDKQQVAYIANHLYTKLNINVSRFGSVWIPAYRSTPPDHPYDLWQYSNTGTVAGIEGNVDMNKNPSKRFKENYLKKVGE